MCLSAAICLEAGAEITSSIIIPGLGPGLTVLTECLEDGWLSHCWAQLKGNVCVLMSLSLCLARSLSLSVCVCVHAFVSMCVYVYCMCVFISINMPDHNQPDRLSLCGVAYQSPLL